MTRADLGRQVSGRPCLRDLTAVSEARTERGQIGAGRDTNAALGTFLCGPRPEGRAGRRAGACVPRGPPGLLGSSGWGLAGAGCHVSAPVGLSKAPGVLAALTDLSLFSQARGADGMWVLTAEVSLA